MFGPNRWGVLFEFNWMLLETCWVFRGGTEAVKRDGL